MAFLSTEIQKTLSQYLKQSPFLKNSKIIDWNRIDKFLSALKKNFFCKMLSRKNIFFTILVLISVFQIDKISALSAKSSLLSQFLKSSQYIQKSPERCVIKRKGDTNDPNRFLKNFRKNSNLNPPERKQHPSSPSDLTSAQKASIECDICKKLFSKNSNLNRHKRRHHPSSQSDLTTKQKEPLEYDIYKKRFSHSGYFKTHQIMDNRKTLFSSNTPHQLSSSQSDLTRKQKEPLECDICKKRFSRSGQLKTHKIMHNRETIFSYNTPHQLSSSQSDLIEYENSQFLNDNA